MNIKVSRQVSQIQGTTANLIEGDTLTINELMYGMMLPSGNDAAVALGVHFGGIIKHGGTKDPEVVITSESIERRLLAIKIVAACNYKNQQERSMNSAESTTYQTDLSQAKLKHATETVQDDLNFERQSGQDSMGQTADSSASMTCKQLFSNFSCHA